MTVTGRQTGDSHLKSPLCQSFDYRSSFYWYTDIRLQMVAGKGYFCPPGIGHQCHQWSY